MALFVLALGRCVSGLHIYGVVVLDFLTRYHPVVQALILTAIAAFVALTVLVVRALCVAIYKVALLHVQESRRIRTNNEHYGKFASIMPSSHNEMFLLLIREAGAVNERNEDWWIQQGASGKKFSGADVGNLKANMDVMQNSIFIVSAKQGRASSKKGKLLDFAPLIESAMTRVFGKSATEVWTKIQQEGCAEIESRKLMADQTQHDDTSSGHSFEPVERHILGPKAIESGVKLEIIKSLSFTHESSIDGDEYAVFWALCDTHIKAPAAETFACSGATVLVYGADKMTANPAGMLHNLTDATNNTWGVVAAL